VKNDRHDRPADGSASGVIPFAPINARATSARRGQPVTDDLTDLRVLAIFHYVLAGVSAVFSSGFLVHFLIGLVMVSGERFFGPAGRGGTPLLVGAVFMVMGGAALLLGWSFAVCLVVAGRSLARRRRYVFCLVIAGLTCLMCNPLGTVLGVLTIVVLNRPSVRALFEANHARTAVQAGVMPPL
jgi:hypothetical protein